MRGTQFCGENEHARNLFSLSMLPAECSILVRRVRGSRAARQPPAASSNSSDTETTDGENILGPQISREKLWGHKVDGGGNRPGESPTRQGLDRELQTFISLRDQTDKATEVRVPERSCSAGAQKVLGER